MTTTPATRKATKTLVRNDHQTLRSLLSELLLARTQSEASVLLGITQPTFSSWYKNPPRHLPSLRVARKVSVRLGIDLAYFRRLAAGPTK